MAWPEREKDVDMQESLSRMQGRGFEPRSGRRLFVSAASVKTVFSDAYVFSGWNTTFVTRVSMHFSWPKLFKCLYRGL